MNRGSRVGVPLALTTPCANCPFRKDVYFFLTAAQAAAIANSTFKRLEPFNCHKTITFDEDTGEGRVKDTSQNCAGALILAEKVGRRGQIAQLAARLSLWSPAVLDMAAPVYADVEDFLDAHRRNA